MKFENEPLNKSVKNYSTFSNVFIEKKCNKCCQNNVKTKIDTLRNISKQSSHLLFLSYSNIEN